STTGPLRPERVPTFTAMEVRYTEAGIHLPAIDLWLDPAESRGAAWLSHAHADHARGHHGTTFGTPETLAIHALRAGPPDEGAAAPPVHVPLPHGTSTERRGARLEAVPASHILGAAQLLVEQGGERL